MKKTLLMILMAFCAVGIYAKDIQELIVTTTPPMSCQNCENKIKGNLRFEKGVKNIETNLADQRVIVTYDADKTDPAKIEKAFSNIGYKVEVISEDCQNQPVKEENCNAVATCGGTCCGGNK